jgi:hypothetical protein
MHPVSTLGLGDESGETAVRKKAKREHLSAPLAQTNEAQEMKEERALAIITKSRLPGEPLTVSNTAHDTTADISDCTLEPNAKQDGPFQNRSRRKSPSPPPLFSSLTWQDSEITGHLADPSIDPEDDGTGLNGIGFRPTPALAYARAQRRRQQVLEWRTREAREARQKRYEQRKRGSSSVRSGLDESKEGNRRTVRFVA